MKSIRITFIILALLVAGWMSAWEPVIHAVNDPRTSAAPCVIMKEEKDRKLTPVTDTNDPLAKFLRAQTPCPTNVFELRVQLTAAGAKLKPALVANRGFHNPIRRISSCGVVFLFIAIATHSQVRRKNFN